jgi:hypothetical protein
VARTLSGDHRFKQQKASGLVTAALNPPLIVRHVMRQIQLEAIFYGYVAINC